MLVCAVSEPTHVASVRREAAEIARVAGLDATATGRLAIVVTELATNQLKHARRGEILIGKFEDRDGYGIEVIGIDAGPGIMDLGASMRDGHSTAGTAGQGLGALKRQSDQFDIVSWPERGAAVLARIYSEPLKRGYRPLPPFVWGGLSIPMAGEVACGDAFSVRADEGHLSALVADGLGHGPMAAAASQAAMQSFAKANGAMPADILRNVHEALRPTRGAAVAALRLDGDSAQYAGIGNIAGIVLRPEGVSRMVSIAGTAGVTQNKIRPFAYPAGPGALIVMTSDGIATSWKLDAYPGLTHAHPSLIAAVVFRDFSRRRDDATVLAIRLGGAMSLVVYRQTISGDRDLVQARSRAMAIAAELGFPAREQTQIATALSEIGRNALNYAGTGEIQFALEPADRPDRLMMRVSDRGPGMPEFPNTASRENGGGPAMGIVAAQKLVDHFRIDSAAGKGTIVEMGKALPKSSAGNVQEVASRLSRIAATVPTTDPLHSMQEQNRQLLVALVSESDRQDELRRLNQELEETNRGVVALYSELDEKAEYLRRASDLKSRFLSHMSHEFRTPLSSILALSRLLLDQVDGPLLSEQQKQVTYIRKSAEGLLELINDLLDIAKVEAGKLSVNCTDFSLGDLFGGLRGVLRPLISRDTVTINFEAKADLPDLRTDEGKVAQILRNFIANAIRFTEEGSIDCTARYHPDRDLYELSVKDSGIGIAPEDQQIIFEEFAQVDGELQQQSRGTGLGLPLSKQLAELLGGHIQLQSNLGAGSVFTLWIPRALQTPVGPVMETAATHRALVIDDEDTFRYIIRQLLGGIEGLAVSEARTAVEGIARARQERPDVIILDVIMPGRGGKEVLRALKAEPELRDIPVVVTTSLPLTERLRIEMQDARTIMAKQNLSSESLRAAITDALAGIESNHGSNHGPNHGVGHGG